MKEVVAISFLDSRLWVIVLPNGAFLRNPGHMSYLKFSSREEAIVEAHRLGYHVDGEPLTST